MFIRPKFLVLAVTGAMLSASAFVHGQVFTDGDFLAADYTSSGAGNQDIRFNVDYSNIDIFGDGFLTIHVPEAPNSSGGSATTGVFLSANNDSLLSATESFSSISPTLSNLNVGNGTATPNYKMTVDVFHSSSAGIDDGNGAISQVGSTNYSLIGLNQTNTTVQVSGLNTGGAGTGGLTGQGMALSITADTGSGDDYISLFGGARYYDRDLGEEPGQLYSQASNNEIATSSSGLISRHLNDYWEAQGLGFEFTDSDGDPTNNLHRGTGNATYYAPDPNDLENYYAVPDGETDPVLTVIKQPFVDAFPEHNDPLHYECGGDNCGLTGDEFLAGNEALFPGVPYNSWATHELYWIDGQFTYVIDDVPVLQITPDSDELNGDDNIFNEVSDAGTALLGFWDRFGGSISSSPEGGNFVIYDNLVVETATSGDAPTPLDYLGANGLLLSTASPGDADGDGDVDGADFLLLQRTNPAGIAEWQANYPAAPLSGLAAASVPEPGTAILLIGLSLGLLSQRKR